MSQPNKHIRPQRYTQAHAGVLWAAKRYAWGLFFLALYPIALRAQPVNDACTNAIPILISQNGFGLDSFASPLIDITQATTESSESFIPAFVMAGLDKKSIWFKFKIATSRSVTVGLAQAADSTIQPGTIGFTVYRSESCFPSENQLSPDLTPIQTFGYTFHPCVDAGDYLIQVSANAIAFGKIFIYLKTAEPNPAPFDKSTSPQNFGKVTNTEVTQADFDMRCLSVDDTSEICLPGGWARNYTKSSWHLVTTPDEFTHFTFWFGRLPMNDKSPPTVIGFRLWEGNITQNSLSQLTPLLACDSFVTNTMGFDARSFRCGELKTNTTYTVQLVYPQDTSFVARFSVAWDGKRPSPAPQWIDSLTPLFDLDTLLVSEKGANNYFSDVFGCASRHQLYDCPFTLPKTGFLRDGFRYNLSNFYQFTLKQAADIVLGNPASYVCGPSIRFRIFKKKLSSVCQSIDSSSLIGKEYTPGQTAFCLDPGEYTLQVMGVDSNRIYTTSPQFQTSGNNGLCKFYHFGIEYQINLLARTTGQQNKFSLSDSTRVERLQGDSLGNMLPLTLDSLYTATEDIFGCNNTVMPDNNFCSGPILYTKASYREFVVQDSVFLHVDTISYQYARIYKGDAASLALAQNKFSYPKVLSGLQPFSNCINSFKLILPYENSCLSPGTYTIVNFGEANKVGDTAKLRFWVNRKDTRYYSPETADNLGSLLDSFAINGTIEFSSTAVFPCQDNYRVIDGEAPCPSLNQTSTKLLYRQFYLSRPSIVQIRQKNPPYPFAFPISLFKGKATSGAESLKRFLTCSGGYDFTDCNLLDSGWYTAVTYGNGPTYDKPLQGTGPGQNLSAVGVENTLIVSLTTCAPPKFNRPYKASIDRQTNQPYLISYGPDNIPSKEYPSTSREYYLEVENLNCIPDTPLSSHPLRGCDPDQQHVAYYVFQIEKESYVKIIPSEVGYYSVVFPFDVRKDSARMIQEPPLQNCIRGVRTDPAIHICRIQPGTYTLVITAPPSLSCRYLKPKIYVDRVATPQYDHAAAAYDFGDVVPDSAWHDGRQGDIHPEVPGRPASSAFIYCNTGASPSDPLPADIAPNIVNPLIYPDKINNVLRPSDQPTYGQDRRNLWYTFTAQEAGTFTIRVVGNTEGRPSLHPFMVFKSDADGAIPFDVLVKNGGVDSTYAQGLTYLGDNLKHPPRYWELKDSVFFKVSGCNFKPTRYYILVDNTYGVYYEQTEIPDYFKRYYPPNSQVTVQILHDPEYLPSAKFDHFSQAYNLDTLQVGGGKVKGGVDNFTCATRDLPDPVQTHTGCQKTLWYKFTTLRYGALRFRVNYRNTYYYTDDQVQLFRQVLPNDSSATGLSYQPAHTVVINGERWAQRCIAAGTYYLLLPGCGANNEDVFPEVDFVYSGGDYCSAPVNAFLNGPGTSQGTLTVDCHTIGGDYGELNKILSCPLNGVTQDYKSSWYRLDIGGTDTLDVTIFIENHTNAGSTDIKYRMMSGNCGAMQEQGCVLDALTQNTYKCMAPGQSYYFQILTPLFVNNEFTVGSIDLKTSASIHKDICIPQDSCLATSNFIFQYKCKEDSSAQFNNFSTFGSNIEYTWDFGFNHPRSHEVSPSIKFPESATDQSYIVTLITRNIACNKADTFRKSITIPTKPLVNLGNDTIVCAINSTYTINATFLPGSLYKWSTGSTSPAISLKESAQVWVEVNYFGCTAADTITIDVNPLRKHPLQIFTWCSKQSIPLNAYQEKGESYSWNIGSSQPSIIANYPGLFWCNISWKNCSLRDSFQLDALTLHPLGADTLLCAHQLPLTLNASAPGAYDYVWNDQSKDPVKTFTAAGNYWVDIFIDSCVIRDTLKIQVIDPIQLTTSPDTFVCAGQSLTLKASGAASYRWTGPNLTSTDSSVTVRPAANAVYKVTGTSKNQCYVDVKDIRVSTYATPVVDAGPDTTILAGSSITLYPTYSADVKSFVWSPAQYLNCTTCSTPVATPFVPITYTLQVTNNYNCQSSDFRTVKLFCNNTTLFIPNTFTPNGDGMNDIFYPRGQGIKSVTYFRIYNRWGELLFQRLNMQTENKSQGWDGTFNGQKLAPDIFVYTIGVICADDKFYETKGNVMILK